MAERFAFTKVKVLALSKKAPGTIAWDTGYSGSLGARAAKDGKVSIFVAWRQGTKQRKKVLGSARNLLEYDGLSIDDVRERAREVVREANEEREGTTRKDAPQTLGELAPIYIRHRTDVDPLRAADARALELALERAAIIWKDKRLGELSATDAEALMDYIGRHHGNYAAGQARSYLTTALAFAKREDRAIDNGIFKGMSKSVKKRFKPQARTRALSKDERHRFFEALRQFEQREGTRKGRGRARRKGVYLDTADAMRMIFFTASRKNEVLKARWRHVNLAQRTWNRPERKNDEHEMVLPEVVAKLLKQVKARNLERGLGITDDDLVFPLVNDTDLFYDFQWVAETGGIDDLRVHDLRRSRISVLLDEGHSPVQVAAAIGSADVETMMRHYSVDIATEEQKFARVNAVGDADLL